MRQDTLEDCTSTLLILGYELKETCSKLYTGVGRSWLGLHLFLFNYIYHIPLNFRNCAEINNAPFFAKRDRKSALSKIGTNHKFRITVEWKNS